MVVKALPKLIILCGGPCSGKSTWAKRYIRNNVSTLRVAKEEIAIMLRGSTNMSTDKSNIVDRVFETAIVAGIMAGYDVIADTYNTNHIALTHYYEVFQGQADMYVKVFREDAEVLNKRVVERIRDSSYDNVYTISRMDVLNHVSNITYLTGLLNMRESPFKLFEDTKPPIEEYVSRHPM